MPSKLTDADKRKVQASVRHARLITMTRRVARIVTHKEPDDATTARRAAMESSMADWLAHFGAEAFSSQWSDDHLRVINKISVALESGGLFALAMPRGHGKSTILKWATLYMLLTGKRKYVMVIAATAELSQSIVEFVRQQITESDLLNDYYPHVCTYARATDGKAIKARYQLRADGKTSGIEWSKNTIVLPTVLNADTGQPHASSGGIVEGHGLTGAIRGKWRDTTTGKVLRPDFALLDDPQTRESAESVSQCDMRERIITGDVLGLAGPRRRIAAVMPCTVIRTGDLAHRFLDHNLHPEWQGETFRLVRRWPNEQEGLWKHYRQIYKGDAADGMGREAAAAYYKDNRDAMDAGADVAWSERVRDGELSALHTAENMLIEMGPQFFAEMQNEPLEAIASQYDLTAARARKCITSTPRLEVPDRHHTLVGFIDINRRGLHWAVASFDQQMSGHVVAYGRWPERGELWEQDASELVRQRRIAEGLAALLSRIAAAVFKQGSTTMRPSLVLIDSGFESQTVFRVVAAASVPFRVLPSKGFAAHRYSPRKHMLVGRPMDGCHVSRSEFGGRFVAFNADQWRETYQRALLQTPGVAGGLTIHSGGAEHAAFIDHLVAEKLANKYETPMGMRWEWHAQPGAVWDWGDAVEGCYVAAAVEGLTSAGIQTTAATQRPKAKVLIRKRGGR